jgi:hypothetical protein
MTDPADMELQRTWAAPESIEDNPSQSPFSEGELASQIVYQGMHFPDTRLKIPCSLEGCIDN